MIDEVADTNAVYIDAKAGLKFLLIEVAGIKAVGMFPDQLQFGAVQFVNDGSGSGQQRDVLDGFGVVGVCMDIVDGKIVAAERMAGEIDAAEGIEPQATAGSRFGEGPHDQRCIDLFAQFNGHGCVGECHLQQEQHVKFLRLERRQCTQHRVGIEEQLRLADQIGIEAFQRAPGFGQNLFCKRHVEGWSAQCDDTDAWSFC